MGNKPGEQTIELEPFRLLLTCLTVTSNCIRSDSNFSFLGLKQRSINVIVPNACWEITSTFAPLLEDKGHFSWLVARQLNSV